jgi:hypothetical protein
MENTLYTVLGLDGKEHENVKLETIKQWYSTRSLNESSLIFSPELGKWQMLKRVFDLSEFHVENTSWQAPNASTSFTNQTQFQTNYPYQTANFSASTIKNAGKSSVANTLMKVVGAVFLLFIVAAGLVGIVFRNRIGDVVLNNLTKPQKQKALLADVKKHELPDKRFVDEATGTTVTLPNNWRRLTLDNPYFTTEDARLIGFDEKLNKGIMLEIMSSPEDIDRAKMSDKVVPLLEDLFRKESKEYKTISSYSLPMKGILATKVTFERIPVQKPNPFIPDSEPRLVTTTVIVAAKNRKIYILQMWCGKNDVADATPEFSSIENSFTIP